MNENVPKWLIPGRVYDVLKWVGLLALPTCAWLFVDAVVLTLNAAGTAIGAVIGASAISAWKGGADD